MHGGCVRPQARQAFADTAYRERHPLRLQRLRPAGEAYACRKCFSNAVRRRPCSVSRPQQTQMQAFRRPPPSGPSEPSFSHSPVVDITAEPATTSGRESDDDNSQQPRPNIIWRAAAAAIGIAQSAFQWLRTHLKPWKLFDRYDCLQIAVIMVSCVIYMLHAILDAAPNLLSGRVAFHVQCSCSQSLVRRVTIHLHYLGFMYGQYNPFCDYLAILCIFRSSDCHCCLQALHAVPVILFDGLCHHDICQSGCEHHYH